jgi:hypothetical protein
LDVEVPGSRIFEISFNMSLDALLYFLTLSAERSVVVATAHSRDVFSISIQEINIWIFSNLVLNLLQFVI